MAATGYLGNLTDEQQAALDSMKQQISALLLESDAEPATPQAPVDGADEPTATSRVLLKLSPAERELFVDDRIMLRFLRARKFNVERAVTMYIAAGNWRRTFHDTGVEMVSELDCPNELASGKSFFYKYDKEGRVVTYIRVRYHDPAKTDMREIQRYTIFIMELGKKLMRIPQENGVIVYDMAEFGLNNMDNEYMKFQIHVMQNYYPESLGLCLVVNAPWIFWTCWNLIQYWIDPVSREKVKFISTAELPQYIDIDDIPKEFGGNDPFEYRYIPPAQREGTGYIPPWEMEWATAPLRVRAEPATPETPAGDTPAPAEQKSGWGWW